MLTTRLKTSRINATVQMTVNLSSYKLLRKYGAAAKSPDDKKQIIMLPQLFTDLFFLSYTEPDSEPARYGTIMYRNTLIREYENQGRTTQITTRSPAVSTTPTKNILASITLLNENLAVYSSSAIFHRKDLSVSTRIPTARRGVKANG